MKLFFKDFEIQFILLASSDDLHSNMLTSTRMTVSTPSLMTSWSCSSTGKSWKTVVLGRQAGSISVTLQNFLMCLQETF